MESDRAGHLTFSVMHACTPRTHTHTPVYMLTEVPRAGMWVECLFIMQKALAFIPHKLGRVAHPRNAGTQKIWVRGSDQDHSGLCNEPSLGYMGCSLKKTVILLK